jgi:hypothetical protein
MRINDRAASPQTPSESSAGQNTEQQQPQETYRITAPRRNLPEGWLQNHSAEADIFLNTLKSTVTRNDDMSRYQDQNGNARLSSHMEGRTGTVDAAVTAVQPKSYASLNLLFFSLNSVTPEEFPDATKKIFADLKFDDDVYKVMKGSESIQDPITRKAVYLAALEQQMHRWNVTDEFGTHPLRYLDVAYRDVQNMDTHPLSPEEARRNIDQILARLREEKVPQPEQSSQQMRDLNSQNPPDLVSVQQLADLASTLFTKDEFLWNVGRTKYNW